MKGTNPPRCAAHRGRDVLLAAAASDQNARPPGFRASPGPALTLIEEIIADLAEKQAALSEYIDKHGREIEIQNLAEILRIHGMNASRLGRLLRDKRALSGDAADGISGAIAQALDELSTELGTDL